MVSMILIYRLIMLKFGMKKLRLKQKKLQQKRAKKEAKRKKIRKEKMKRHNAFVEVLNRMSDEELKEFLGEDYYEDEDEDEFD